jgi:hypothetical protein
VSAFAEAIGISSTSKSLMILTQYHIRENGDKLLDALNDQANDFLIKNHIDNAQIIAYVRNIISTIDDKNIKYPIFNTIIAQIITFNASTLSRDEAIELHKLLIEITIDKLLHTTRIPINTTLPIYEQVLTTGHLIPATQSMSRTALFAIFDEQYDMKVNLQSNFINLAKAIQANVVFVSMVSQVALEFDSRGLFNEHYLRKNDLIIPKFCGLCDKVLTRYNTIKKLNPSHATVPHYFKYFNNYARTLVIESLVGNMFRIMKTVIQYHEGEIETQNYFTDNSACLFLLEGQSTRADEYNRRIEEQIFANGQSEFAQSIINASDDGERGQMISNIIRGNFITLMHQYAHTDKILSPNKIDDIFAMLILAYKTEQKSETLLPSFAFFAPQLFKVAIVINNKIDEHSEELKGTIQDNNFAERERIFDIIINEATAEDIFVFTITANIQLMTARAKFFGTR